MSKIYELRIYTCLPGRLPALSKRFETKTLKIWDKHGIKQAGFFTTLVGESNQTLTYLLEWNSLAERETKWNAFQADPEWIRERAETEKDGQIVANIASSFPHADVLFLGEVNDRPIMPTQTWSRPRGLDHVVHAVRDLDAAAEFYARAGFQVGGRNRHPWGTHNCIIQLPGFFIELLEVAEPEKIVPFAPGQFSFGAFQRDFLKTREGLSMVLLASSDARADSKLFYEAGIGGFEVFDFEREGAGPDGALIKLAFSLAFARDELSPHTGFAVCQHHYPQNFWNPARQVHENGTSGVGGLILVADNPADHHIFLSAFTGVRLLHSNSIGVKSVTPHGDIEIMEAPSFRDQFGIAKTMISEGAELSGLRLQVGDLDRLEAQLRAGGIVCHRRVGRVVIAQENAFGTTLIFEQMQKA